MKEHKRNVHPKRHSQNNKQLKKTHKRVNETELECVIVPFRNFNVAEDIIQRQDSWQEVILDSREVQSDED